MKDIEYTIFDLEWTTRKDKKSYIIEIGAIKIKDGEIIGKFNRLLKYRKPIDPKVSELTGITEEMLKYGEDRENSLFEFMLFIEETVLVAHDIANDMKVLKEEYYRLGLYVENKQLCTLKLSQKIFLVEKYNLQYLASFLDIKVSNKHRAYGDAYILYNIFKKLLNSLPEDIKKIDEIINLNKRRKKLIKRDVEIIEIDLDLKYRGFFDGASAGNPGKMGTGFVIFSEHDEIIVEGANYTGIGTNNEAEYQALIFLLEFAVTNNVQELEIFGDSQLVIKQVLKEWKVKAENLKPFARKAQDLYSRIPKISLKWIRRESNTAADALSKKGVNASK